jgi:multidrug transporter EmrE-like cation transporter
MSISFGVISSLIVKWKMSSFSYFDYPTWQDKIYLGFSMLINPYVICAMFFSLLAGVFWMISMTKFEISYAYPFTLLGLVFVTIFSIIFFGESLNFFKTVGIIFILIGVIVISKGL